MDRNHSMSPEKKQKIAQALEARGWYYVGAPLHPGWDKPGSSLRARISWEEIEATLSGESVETVVKALEEDAGVLRI